MGTHLIGNDACQSGFPQSGRPVEKHMVQCVSPEFRRFYVYLKIFLYFGLTDVVIQFLWPKGTFYFNILFGNICLNHSLGHVFITLSVFICYASLQCFNAIMY